MAMVDTGGSTTHLDFLMFWRDPDSWKIWAGFIAGVLALLLVYMAATGEIG